ncbi:MAG: hypothetical protein AAGA23_10495 [Pseudomonadota bacterium]
MLRNGLRLSLALTVLLLSACASTPEGFSMVKTANAPDPETGAGCAAFGVMEDRALAVPTAQMRFEMAVVSAREITRQCDASNENGTVWGCYRPDTGKAYMVGKDWKVYWHEWCHAKFGPTHVSLARNGKPQRSYLYYIASAQEAAPVSAQQTAP